MGSQVIATCGCGLEESLRIGGGMRNFQTTCLFPCLCEHCHRIVEVSLLKRSLKCPACHAPDPIPYDDPRLSTSPGQQHVAEWDMEVQLGRTLVLTDGRYRCPRCGEMSLEFREGGRWD